MSMRGPNIHQTGTGPSTKGGEQPCPLPPSDDTAAVGSVTVPSPLTAFLTRKELVPYVLYLEKSLLVLKEHDYAKAPDRAAILQSSSILEHATNSNEETKTRLKDSDSRSPKPTSSNELLNCFGELARLRCHLLRSNEDPASRHLREVISLQAALVREQQEQLYAKDRELASTRKERDQLKARLERMERRLAVHQKRNLSYSLESESSPMQSSTLSTPRLHSRRGSLITSERFSRSRSSSVERLRTKLRLQSHSSTPLQHEEGTSGKRMAKKRLRIEENSMPVELPVKRVRKPAKPSEVRTKFEYCGLNLSSVVPEQLIGTHGSSVNHVNASEGSMCEQESKTKSSLLSNDVLSSEVARKTIVVPCWKLTSLDDSVSNKPCLESTEYEDLCDDMFMKRHKKHEEDEKRRKRWDLQRARAILEHEELLKKYNKKSGLEQIPEKKKDKISTFLPKIEEVQEIEVLPTLTVSAFGQPIPLLKRRDFMLPWFDLDAREDRENVRTTRSKTRASRNSVGSSDDS